MPCSPQAHAATIDIEPDNFPEGTDIRTAFPRVTLSVADHPEREVHAVSGFSAFNGRNLATTGKLVFGQFPPPSATVPQGWDEANLGLLRVDFEKRACFVAVDLNFDDDDVGVLRAYDGDNNPLSNLVWLAGLIKFRQWILFRHKAPGLCCSSNEGGRPENRSNVHTLDWHTQDKLWQRFTQLIKSA